MEKKIALFITSQFDQLINNNQSSYEMEKLDLGNEMINGFHQWAKGKRYVAAYHVSKPDESNLYLLFIDWHRNHNYYLVIYSGNKSTTLAEINRVNEIDGENILTWVYNPLKRDGKNQQRKAYFKQIFGSTTIHLSIPKNVNEVPDFIAQLFALSRNRLKADQIVDVFDM